MRIVAGQALSWSPAGPSRSSPVSSVTCASSIQHARWAHPAVRAGVAGAALADLAAAIDRDLPRAGGDQAQRRFLPLAQRPADRVDDLVPGPGGELVQVPDQVVAGPTAPSHVIISFRRKAGGGAAIAASASAM